MDMVLVTKDTICKCMLATFGNEQRKQFRRDLFNTDVINYCVHSTGTATTWTFECDWETFKKLIDLGYVIALLGEKDLE